MTDISVESRNTDRKLIEFKIFGLESEAIEKILFESGLYSKYRCKFQTDFLDTLLIFEFEQSKFTPEVFNAVLTAVYNLFGEKIYAESNISLGKTVVEMLSIRARTLSVAESLTGGLISDKIVQNSGASKVFLEGVVTYSNQSKIERLGVNEKIVEQYGAVSEEVSLAMCKGLTDGRADYALSTTGIAGPTGGSLTKPVGLCYISVGNSDFILTKKYIFNGDREDIRQKSANTALFMMIKFMKSH